MPAWPPASPSDAAPGSSPRSAGRRARTLAGAIGSGLLATVRAGWWAALLLAGALASSSSGDPADAGDGNAAPLSRVNQGVRAQAGQADAGPAGADVAAWERPPGCTPRKNKFHIAQNGSDATGDGSRRRPWATLMANVRKIPPDSEIIYADGVFPDLRGAVYSSYGARPQIADHITIRGESWQGTTLRGPTAGDAFTLHRENLSNSETDFEICGLVLENWKTGNPKNGGTGVFTVSGQVNGLRIIGNRISDFGDEGNRLDHLLYVAEGPDYERTIRNIRLEWNDISSFNDIGALLVHSWNNIAGNAAREVVIRYNRVRGIGEWGMVLAPFWDGGPANWEVYQNDVRIQAKVSVVHFFTHGGGSTANGADASFQLRDNTLENSDEGTKKRPGIYGTVILRSNIRELGRIHTPTIRGNLLYSSGQQPVVAGVVLDPSNRIGVPGDAPTVPAP